MSSVLPFEIIALIIDIVGENNDADLLKERNLLWSLIPSTRSAANIYLPPSNFMKLIGITAAASHLQRRDSSSYLEADQILSSISANSRIPFNY